MNATPTMRGSLSLRVVLRSARLFYVVFGMYTAAAVFLLLVGVGSALATLSGTILDAFQDAVAAREGNLHWM
jgi:hypothetical protein